MLDYKLVEALAAVVAEGGFERAGRVLGLTQSAVSQRVKQLEETAGRVLLVRSSPPRPTQAGREVIALHRRVRHLENDLWAGLGRGRGGMPTLAVGINADSLATWFFPALDTFLDREPMLLDLRVDDQARTHALLRDGEVAGCVSDRATPVQGCAVHLLGVMRYRLYATPSFREQWFPAGVTREAMGRAPLLIFNRKDAMHTALLSQALGGEPASYAAWYLPSSERFAPVIGAGRACGLLPDEQAAAATASGELADLLPGHVHTVCLFWHCWNFDAGILGRFTEALIAGARSLLDRGD
ncbi:ArgP/LysG family DNA-binding transcriptional regulator [Pseudodesulfovibrio sp. F-1]|uniref:ArgP/LysG family DNA-binding transcriptional regulator n=1 Tax=Pseudodesulfovibrio alkaliphilus TaxID=2661613 RepID=A0A7K1KNJ3_9BACT|nr:LysR family transcriptional regulator ArgP [Pseudodesulfovibrio alkaliphilus]MUM77664.1 ArgP/LysG family DNA-binding transcriptional regulator [Pseudodesulfovibrio alkaliphilus]